MKTTTRAVLGAVAALTLAATGASAATADGHPTPSTTTPNIIGGSYATSPYIVQLVFSQNGGTYGCTGEAISSQWVLTAQHCTAGDQWMDVYYSNSTTSPGTPVAADAVYNSPNGDVGLVHLSTPRSVSSYGQLASSYTPSTADSGTIYGYGARANGAQSDHLYKATVNVLGSSTDAYGGRAIHVQGVDGASNHGDSGGPLVIGGKIVGVCSTGDVADPGANTQARSNYANLTGSRNWIASTTGI